MKEQAFHKSTKGKLFLTILLILMLNLISLSSLYSALHKGGEFLDKDTLFKQIFWIILGWGLVLIIFFVNYRIFYDLSIWLYSISMFLLIIVAILGTTRMGAQRWVQILGITFQPSEFAKLAALLITTRNLSKIKDHSAPFLKDFWKEVISPFIPLLSLFFIIFIQPDLGTSLILIFLFMMMLIGCGIKKRNALIFFLIILTVLPFGWVTLKDYQKDRLLVFINPNSDPLGAGYTIIQSKIAIGSGKILGKGFLAGTQNQLNFTPARHTDFIFTVIAEEWGFLGCLILLAIYYLLLKIILDTASMVKDRYSYILCVGIFSLFLIHIFINIAMVMSILPVVGLPLLFLSYGGSHTLANFILLGIFLNILRNTS